MELVVVTIPTLTNARDQNEPLFLYDLEIPTAAGSSSQVRDQIIKILEIVNIR